MSDAFLNIKVILGEGEVYDRDMDDDLHIDKNDLEKELMSQAGKYAWWATLSALAQDKVNRLKKDLDVYEATASQAIRAEKSQKNEKTTEGGIGELMRMLPEWQKAKDCLLDAQKQLGVLDAAREAFGQRQHMLRALAMECGRPSDLSVMRTIAEETIRSSKKSQSHNQEG